MAQNHEYQLPNFLCRLKELMEEVETLKAERAVIESELKNTNPDMQTVSAAASGSLNEPNISLASLGRTFGPLQHQVRALSLVAQKAKLGFKLLLLERLNENLKQKHF